MQNDLRHRFYALYDGAIAFSEWCALRFQPGDGDDIHVHMPFLPRLSGPDGAISAGIAAALADVAAGQTSVPALGWRKQMATVRLQQSMLAPIPKGRGLVAAGRVASCRNDLVHVDIRIAAEDQPGTTLIAAQARMIAVRTVEALDTARPAFALHGDFNPDPRFGPEGMETTATKGGIEGILPFQAHFMGNAARGAQHGGLVAAALHIAASRFGATLTQPLGPLDSTVDYLATARPARLILRLRAEHTGRRIAFLSGQALQDDPSGGAPITVARFTATLGNLAE